MMENEFQMSMMGELTFFLDIQVKQMKQDTFVHQANYMKDLMKKFNMSELKPVSTSMSTATSLGPDEDGDVVNQMEYMSLIGSLLYLTAARPDIKLAVCCVRAFRLPYALHTGQSFSESLGISTIHLSFGFGILLLLYWILLAFLMLILRVVGLIKRALLGLVIFLDLSFAGLHKNNLQLLNPPQMLSM
jgi:hypothetical protein